MPMLRMLFIILAITFLATVGVHGQELDATFVIGKWYGKATSTVSQGAALQVEFKEDGAFEGFSSAQQFGQTLYNQGRWKLEGGTINAEFLIDNPRTRAHNTKITWAVRRNGDGLAVSAVRHFDQARFNVDLVRTK